MSCLFIVLKVLKEARAYVYETGRCAARLVNTVAMYLQSSSIAYCFRHIRPFHPFSQISYVILDHRNIFVPFKGLFQLKL